MHTTLVCHPKCSRQDLTNTRTPSEPKAERTIPPLPNTPGQRISGLHLTLNGQSSKNAKLFSQETDTATSVSVKKCFWRRHKVTQIASTNATTLEQDASILKIQSSAQSPENNNGSRLVLRQPVTLKASIPEMCPYGCVSDPQQATTTHHATEPAHLTSRESGETA